MSSEHVVATSAAHILQFSTTLITRLVRLPIRKVWGRSPSCSSVERFVHGETPGFGGPDVTPRACSTRGGPFQAEPLTPRRLHLGPGALSRPLPPLRPSPFPASPREGGRLVTNKDALTSEDLRRGAFEHDASRRPSMTRCSSRGIPLDPLLFGFTRVALAPLDSPKGTACRLLQLRHDPRTNPRSRSSCSWFELGAACLRRSLLAEHHRTRSANSHQRRAPSAGYPSILVASPNPEGQESPSYHRQDLGPASQHTPRRACLGYGPDAFHYRPSGASDSFSEPIRVTPDSFVPPLLPAHVTMEPFLPTERPNDLRLRPVVPLSTANPDLS